MSVILLLSRAGIWLPHQEDGELGCGLVGGSQKGCQLVSPFFIFLAG